MNLINISAFTLPLSPKVDQLLHRYLRPLCERQLQLARTSVAEGFLDLFFLFHFQSEATAGWATALSD
jgi:hypothetical protein